MHINFSKIIFSYLSHLLIKTLNKELKFKKIVRINKNFATDTKFFSMSCYFDRNRFSLIINCLICILSCINILNIRKILIFAKSKPDIVRFKVKLTNFC